MDTVPSRWVATIKKITDQFNKAVQWLEQIHKDNENADRREAEAHERDHRSNVSLSPTRVEIQSFPALSQDEDTYRKHKRTRERVGFHIGWITLAVLSIYTGIVGVQTWLTRIAIRDSEDSFKKTLWQMQAQTAAQQDAACASARTAQAMADQLESMGEQLGLQREIARLEHGAKVRVTRISIYHDADKISADIVVENDGKATAVQISTARKIEFRKSPPTIDVTKFKVFEPTKSDQLGPSPDNGRGPEATAYGLQIPIPRGYSANKSGAEDIYIWGVIRYSDFTGEDVRDPFCEQISAKQVFEGPPGIVPGKGASPPLKDCPISTARNQQPPANQPHHSNPK